MPGLANRIALVSAILVAGLSETSFAERLEPLALECRGFLERFAYQLRQPPEARERGFAVLGPRDVVSVKRVSARNHVYRVEGPGSVQYVRVQGLGASAKREDFIAGMFGVFPTVRAARPQVLGVVEGAAMIREIRRHVKDGPLWPGRVSVSQAQEGKLGNDVLSSLYVGELIGSWAARAKGKAMWDGTPERFIAKQRQKDVDRLRGLWRHLTEREIEFLARRILEEIPEARERKVTPGNLLAFLEGNLELLADTKGLRDLREQVLRDYPPEIKAAIADYWSTCLMLLVYDCHPGNWALHGSSVTAFDLGDVGNLQPLIRESSLFRPSRRHSPVAGGRVDERRAREILSWMSPGQRARIEGLSPEELVERAHAEAARAGYSLSKEELTAMLAMRRELADFVRSSP